MPGGSFAGQRRRWAAGPCSMHHCARGCEAERNLGLMTGRHLATATARHGFRSAERASQHARSGMLADADYDPARRKRARCWTGGTRSTAVQLSTENLGFSSLTAKTAVRLCGSRNSLSRRPALAGRDILLRRLLRHRPTLFQLRR